MYYSDFNNSDWKFADLPGRVTAMTYHEGILYAGTNIGTFKATDITSVDENKIVVDSLKLNSLAKQEGFAEGDFISEFKIENLDRPDKAIVYPFAILLLFLFGYFNYRRKPVN